jgi:hypothetical protein
VNAIFRRALHEYVEHYHSERNHQGLHNALIAGVPAIGTAGRVIGDLGWEGS